MLTPNQVTQTGDQIEKICREFESELSLKLSELLEFLHNPNLSALDKEEVIQKSREIISEFGARLRKKTNQAVIDAFRQFAAKSVKSDMREIESVERKMENGTA